MTPEDQMKIDSDPEFILLKRFSYSATEALKRHPDGLPDNLLAQALGRTAAWVAERYTHIVEQLRVAIGE